jgi:hypothetical protein
MNRIIATIIFFALAIFPGLAMAGGDCVLVRQDSGPTAVTDYAVFNNRVLIKCTAAADQSMSDAFDTAIMDALTGRWITDVAFYPAAAGAKPSSDTSCSMVDSVGRVILTATTNCLEKVDDADTRTTYPQGPDGNSGNYRAADHQPITYTWTDNTTASGVGYIEMTVTGSRNQQ